MITNITIQNIKGFGTKDNSIDLGLDSKKINILVAPNGYGKSSIAMAFKAVSKNSSRLVIDIEDKYRKDASKDPLVSITMDGQTYQSTPNQNDIAKNIHCFVINCLLTVKTTSKRFQNFTTSKGYMDIKNIEVAKVIRKPQNLYSIQRMKILFGRNANKIVESISYLLQNEKFIVGIKDLYSVFRKFNMIKREKILSDIQHKIQHLGEKDTSLQIVDSFFDDLENDDYYQQFKKYLTQYVNLLTKSDCYQTFFQLIHLFNKHKDWLSGLSDWTKYLNLKKRIQESIQIFNTSTWTQAEIKEEKGILKVFFPKANEVSNGQRDVLTFITQLIVTNAQLSKSKPNLVIIDEVFDYMDDATHISAQYYLSKMLNINKGNIYIIMMTHLDPNNFKSYIFSKKVLNIEYLSKSSVNISNEMRAFIKYRSGLNTEDDMYKKLSRYFYHYDPDNSVDLTEIDKPEIKNLKKSLFDIKQFKMYVLKELNGYLRGDESYDPYSVCFALRFGIEKKVYDSLSNDDEKEQFIKKHGTEKKLDYAEDHCAKHSESFHILSAIYNDAEHASDYAKDKRCIYKLENKVIRDIIRSIFEYKGQDISIENL